MISARQAGTLFPAATIRVKAGGLLKTVVSGRIMVSGALKTFYTAASSSPLSLAISPDSIDAIGFNSTVTSGPFTATPTGGTGPFSYAWEIVSYDGNLPTILNPAFATTGFRYAGLALNETHSAVVRCTATDSVGATASDTADVSFHRESLE